MEFGVQQKKNQVLAPMRLETAKKNPQPVRKMLHDNNARRPSLVVNSLFPHSASHTNARCFCVLIWLELKLAYLWNYLSYPIEILHG